MDQLLLHIGQLSQSAQATATKHLLKTSQVLESYMRAKQAGCLKQETVNDLAEFVNKFTKETDIELYSNTIGQHSRAEKGVNVHLRARDTGEAPGKKVVILQSNSSIRRPISKTTGQSDVLKVKNSHRNIAGDISDNSEKTITADDQKVSTDVNLIIDADYKRSNTETIVVKHELYNTLDEESFEGYMECDEVDLSDTERPDVIQVEPSFENDSSEDNPERKMLVFTPRASVDSKTTVPAQCEICDKKFSTAASLKVHRRSHDGERPFDCSMCPQAFTTKGNLRRHERSHLGIKTFECTECHKKFGEKRARDIHQRTHSGIKPFKCDTCDMSFTQLATLQNHRHIHTGWKGHLCDICGKSFRQKANLSQHKLRHNADKPFGCTVCDAKFPVKGDLHRHMNTHTGTKPFQCSLCTRSFSRMTYLSDHMNVHMGTRPYKCSKCPAAYSERSAYYKHTLKEHSTKPKDNTENDSILLAEDQSTVLLGEDAELESSNQLTVSQSEGDTFVLFVDGSGKQQLIPVKPASDVTVCEEVVEEAENDSGAADVTPLRTELAIVDSTPKSHDTQQWHALQNPNLIVTDSFQKQEILTHSEEIYNSDAQGRCNLEEIPASRDAIAHVVGIPVEELASSAQPLTLSNPSIKTVVGADGTQHVELILTDENPDLFLRQLEQLTSGAVEVVVNEHDQVGNLINP